MLLGDIPAKRGLFPALDAAVASLLKVEKKDRYDAVGKTLLQWILDKPSPCFLLAQVLEFVAEIDRSNVIPNYTFSHFELWLNHSSGLGFEENRKVRGKIIGKWVDRSDYHVFFPIGTGKVYEGTHFVTAHKSPDLDTTIASFWGWIDAFGARVGNGLHVWNLPGGPPSSQIEIQWIFQDLFGEGVLTHLPKTRTTLHLNAKDLLAKGAMTLKSFEDSMSGIDHEGGHRSVVVVDADGTYVGDFRSVDVEEVRQIIILVSMLLRWFENQLYLHLIACFAMPNLLFSHLKKELEKLFSMQLCNCEPAQEFSFKQQKDVSCFLKDVLHMKEGLSISIEDFCAHLSRFAGISLEGVKELLTSLKPLFNAKETLLEERPKMFSFLEAMIRRFHSAILVIRTRLERLDVALKAKSDVFERFPTSVNLRSDMEEILQKMGSHISLTVTDGDTESLFPLGIILSQDARKPILGTVSLRDFCNREEMGIPAYLDVISVIDHHKSQLHTSAPPFAIIADAQSSNSLVANQTFSLNDKYSLGGLSKDTIEKQIRDLSGQNTPKATRLLQRLLKKRVALSRQGEFFVDPEREYAEYLHFLYGILDDTDLLSKVTLLDLECVVSLVNRLKSIAEKKEVEVLALDDIARDKHFLKQAAKTILMHEEMYSLYHKVYAHREKEVEENIRLAAEGKPSFLFQDTKVQNGCCRIGQTKVFPRNIALLLSRTKDIQKAWIAACSAIYAERKEIDLHIHMISTVVSAEQVYGKAKEKVEHQDEMWIWAPLSQELAAEHLKKFLISLQLSPGLKDNPIEIEVLGDKKEEYKRLVTEVFPHGTQIRTLNSEMSCLILRYKAGSLNSRKAMVAPFLPVL